MGDNQIEERALAEKMTRDYMARYLALALATKRAFSPNRVTLGPAKIFESRQLIRDNTTHVRVLVEVDGVLLNRSLDSTVAETLAKICKEHEAYWEAKSNFQAVLKIAEPPEQAV